MKKVYVLEYRDVKKNVDTFGLKHWFEGIGLVCLLEDSGEITPESIQKIKIANNLGKIQSEKNSIQVKTKKGLLTRPSNMFEDLESMLCSGIKLIKEHYFSNKITEDVPIYAYCKSKNHLELLITVTNNSNNNPK